MYHKFSTCMANEISQWVSTFEVNVNIIYFGSREMQELQKIRLDALWPDTQGLLGNLIWGKVGICSNHDYCRFLHDGEVLQTKCIQLVIRMRVKYIQFVTFSGDPLFPWWGSSSNKVHVKFPQQFEKCIQPRGVVWLCTFTLPDDSRSSGTLYMHAPESMAGRVGF
jgi:hypothetical protein